MPTDADILALAAETIDNAFIGTMCTVDPDGRPRARYMAAAVENQALQYVYSLTATETRKVTELRANPNVCWLFATAKYERTVKLEGEAMLTNTEDMPLSSWNRLIDYADSYVTAELRDKQHYAFFALVTRVRRVEVLCPDQGLSVPHPIALE